MKSIRSTQNETYKSLLKLTKKRGRDERGVFLLEGEKLIKEAAARGAEIVTAVFRDEEQAGETAQRLALPDSVSAVLLREDLFDRLTDQVTPSRVLAVVAKPAHNAEILRGRNIVVLDRIQDPGNVGALIRTAEAAGFAGIIAVKGTVDFWSQKVCRSAAGAIVRMPLFQTEDADATLAILSKLGLRPVVCDMDGEPLYAEGALAGNIALIIGNEGGGVSRAFADAAECTVGIPMSEGSESLNAAVAAGIVMYEKRRQEEFGGK
ncbi:MAG: RNA methyltransferase [Clostridiales Family XIII bacterium]|nr:RNA methyltransferase [Clostridiales Family XIII bacterium]